MIHENQEYLTLMLQAYDLPVFSTLLKYKPIISLPEPAARDILSETGG
ncbi:MAG: hypothetical protein K2P67_01600 [Gallionellaceae bacterium]|nr:hypothetical protein [Gallionellaceae bacterium]